MDRPPVLVCAACATGGRGLDVFDDGAEERMVARIVWRKLKRHVDRWNAGQSERDAMERIRMRQRTGDRGAVHHLRHIGEQIADLAAGQRRRNHAELAADFRRRLRFGIDPLKLTGRAVKVNQNDRFRPAKSRLALL